MSALRDFDPFRELRRRSPTLSTPVSIPSSVVTGGSKSVGAPKLGRPRIDLAGHSPADRRHRERRREYYSEQKFAEKLRGIKDKDLLRFLRSPTAGRLFPETQRALTQVQGQAAAVAALDSALLAMPSRAPHRSALVGKIRQQLTWKEFDAVFSTVSRKYAERAKRALQKKQAEGVTTLWDQRYAGVKREKVSPLELKITLSTLEDNVGQKSGSLARYWYGDKGSFEQWYRTTGFPLIVQGMVTATGSTLSLQVELGQSKWLTQNLQAFTRDIKTCDGTCQTAPVSSSAPSSSSSSSSSSTQVCRHVYQPRSHNTLMRLLDSNKFRLTYVRKVVPCPHHANYDSYIADLKTLQSAPRSFRSNIVLFMFW